MAALDLGKVKPQVEQLLGALLQQARFDLQFQMQAGTERYRDLGSPELVVNFSGPDIDLLLERGGELLEALEQIVTKSLRLPLTEQGKIVFDCRDYRILRLDELRLMAETAAERVAHGRMPFSLNPMSSRDRRIVHLALKENPAVRTESDGGGPYRKVVIYPAEK